MRYKEFSRHILEKSLGPIPLLPGVPVKRLVFIFGPPPAMASFFKLVSNGVFLFVREGERRERRERDRERGRERGGMKRERRRGGEEERRRGEDIHE